jgi:predicted metal-dependent peptidase
MPLSERLKRVYDHWYLKDPAMLMILSTHELVMNSRIKGIRSGQSRIEYNPDFLSSLDDIHLENALRAEVIRILLRHPYRYPPRLAAVSYMASNITINEYYSELDLPYRVADFWTDKDYNRQFFEFYYRELLALAEAQAGAEDSEQEDEDSAGAEDSDSSETDSDSSGTDADLSETDSGSAGTGEGTSGTDSGSGMGKAETGGAGGAGSGMGEAEVVEADVGEGENAALWREDEYTCMRIEEQIESLQASNMWGSVSGKLLQHILATLKPQLDYRRVLSGFRASIQSSERILTRRRPSRRYGFLFMGKRTSFTTNLLVGIDVSASIRDRELQAFYSAVNRFFRYGIEHLEVQAFDYGLQGEPLPLRRARREISLHGRGGTSFNEIIHMFEDNRKYYDGLVIFTDGDAQLPEVRQVNRRFIVWVCTDQDSYQRHEKWMRERGRCCFFTGY